jgi:prepilin-type N-terminal cleavage/methylation domain-containing protein
MTKGFTLAELLIALAILGVIATFTIPKVLQAQQDGKWKSMAKESAATVSEAFQLYKLKNGVNGSVSSADLMPYINYVAWDTVGTIDDDPANTTINCSNGWERCLKMHNGGTLRLISISFGGTATTNAIGFGFDPDGKVTGGGNGKMVNFTIYYDGLLTSVANRRNNTYTASGGPYGPNPAQDPDWFSWD